MKVIHLCPSTYNKGDDFVAIGIKKLLTNIIPDIEYRAIAAHSKIDINNYGIGGINSETYDLLNSNDLIVIGGSNLYETMQLEVDLQVLKKITKPILLIGIGSGWDFKHPTPPKIKPEHVEIIKLLHDKAIGSSVRDHMTKRVLKHNGINEITVTGCPAAFIYDNQLRPVVDNPVIYLSCLPYRMYEPQNYDPRIILWRTSYKRKRSITKSFIKLFEQLNRHGYQTRIFISDQRDLPIADKLCKSAEIIFSEDPRNLLEQLDQASVVVGYRLHSIIPAVGMGIPIIPINSDGRTAGFVETFGLIEFAVNPMEPDSQSKMLDLVRLATSTEKELWKFMIENKNYYKKKMAEFLIQSLEKIN